LRLPEICIRKPVLAIVLSLVLVVLGVLGFQHLEIRFFPKIEIPVVTITTHYEGASANLMESQVTTIIENYLAGIDGVQYISSRSWTSYSQITVQFRLGGDIESEAAQVRDKVSGAVQYIPPDADKPTITVGANANPILGIGFLDKHKKPADIRDYILRNVQPVLRQLPGVGAVSVLGSSGYAMRVWLDPAKMAATGISVDDVKTAITSNNIYFPAGQIHGKARNYSVVSDTKLKNAAQFASIIVKQTPNGTIRLGGIADVKIGLSSLYDYPMLINGQNGIMVLVDPLQAANPIKVAQEVRTALKSIETKLPPGMKAEQEFDMSKFLHNSIYETFEAIGEAVILVILVVFFFLGSFRAACIPIVTIPVSLISVFAIIDYLGFTINIMSLLGMVLAIGLVVDDAIVMLENIHRHIEEGMTPMAAAFKGSKEIGFAIVAMSITLVAVYAPVGFIQGFTAELFKEFAFTLAGAVVISGFVALTLSPMMCSRILTSENSESRLAQFLDNAFEKLALRYKSFLGALIKARFFVVIGLIVIAVLGYFIYLSMNSEFIPQEDYGTMNVSIVSPTGASIGYTEKYTDMIEKVLNKIPLIQDYSTQVGVGSTMLRVEMKPWGKERNVTTQTVVTQLNKDLARIPGVTATASVPDIISVGDTGSDIQLNFMTTQDYDVLLDPMNKLVGLLRQYPGLLNVQTNLKFDSQQYAISFNRDLAAIVGVSLQDVADTVHSLMSGNHWTDVTSGSQSYQVLVQMERSYLSSLDAVDAIYVPSKPPMAPSSRSKPAGTPSGFSNMIPLSTLVNLTPTIGQGTLRHFDRMRSGTITALVAPGYTESQAIAYIDSKLPEVMKPDISVAYSGKAEQFLDSAGSMTGIMTLSFIFIYLVLSAQFGSFLDPFIILLAVPLSMVGALFSLWVAGGTFNLYSQIGLVTLVGMISKHGILITQFINDLRKDGLEMREAILEGAMIRLRPVLMTTCAMIFGSLPLALASGPGSIGRVQIGWTIVGGLFFGTFFSLVVVPIAYSYLGGFKKIKRIELS
jgi:multidrug efflux pump